MGRYATAEIPARRVAASRELAARNEGLLHKLTKVVGKGSMEITLNGPSGEVVEYVAEQVFLNSSGDYERSLPEPGPDESRKTPRRSAPRAAGT